MKHVKSSVTSAAGTWYLWLFPLFAIALSLWLFWGYYDQRGPMLRLHFEDATGIKEEKTRIRYRGVVIGTVKKMTLGADSKDAVVHVQLQRDTESFAVKGSRFWLVIPKVGLGGVTGLETIFEGTYIDVIPGAQDGERETEFKAQVGRETTESLEGTTPYHLETANAESIGVDDSVTFRGLKVGTVTRVGLSKTAQTVNVQINVQNKYARLVRTNTAFWRKVGVQAKLGLFGSEVRINSIDSILHGGIELFTPTDAGPVAKAGSRFDLLATPPKDAEKWNPRLEND